MQRVLREAGQRPYPLGDLSIRSWTMRRRVRATPRKKAISSEAEYSQRRGAARQVLERYHVLSASVRFESSSDSRTGKKWKDPCLEKKQKLFGKCNFGLLFQMFSLTCRLFTNIFEPLQFASTRRTRRRSRRRKKKMRPSIALRTCGMPTACPPW